MPVFGSGSLSRRGFLSVFLWIALLCMVCGTAMAQSTAVLKGTVTDPSGAGVPNAKVVAKNQATGGEWNSQSDNTGSYLIPSLPIGNYNVTVTVAGFQKTVIQNIILAAATTVTQNVQLQVGQVDQQVLVTVETPVIDASTITMGQVIDQKTTQEIPLNGRHFVDLSLLTPGTVTPPQNGFLTAPLRGQGSFAFNTAGRGKTPSTFW